MCVLMLHVWKILNKTRSFFQHFCHNKQVLWCLFCNLLYQLNLQVYFSSYLNLSLHVKVVLNNILYLFLVWERKVCVPESVCLNRNFTQTADFPNCYIVAVEDGSFRFTFTTMTLRLRSLQILGDVHYMIPRAFPSSSWFIVGCVSFG
jgi:hypothetical protein